MTKTKLSATKELQAQQRQDKLAAALRTNLRRRKAQARDRDAADQDGEPDSAQADRPANSQ